VVYIKVDFSSLQKISFAWASGVIGAVGVGFIGKGEYFPGTAFILLALGLEVLREYLKSKGIVIKKK